MNRTEPVIMWTAIGQALAAVAEQTAPTGAGWWHALMAGLTAFVARAQVSPRERDSREGPHGR